MFRKFSIEELAVMAILLEEEESGCVEKQLKKRRFAVHPMNVKRKKEGEFYTLFKELVDDEERFLKYFRMSKYEFETIVTKIKPMITKQDTKFKESLSPREKVAVCLRFLATGDSYLTIAYSYRLGVSTVHNIIVEVCTAIIKEMTEECMPTPTKKKWLKISEEFWHVWNFPNCLGAIDGKHVVITAPANSGSLYFNYKKTFSIVLMAIVDANYKFICVDIGAYGKNSDGGIFSNSIIGKALPADTLNVPEEKYLPGTEILMPHVIIGDEAFPLKTYLMRPYPQPQTHVQCKRNFNDRLSRARKVVENTFGQLAQKFRLYNRRIQLKPENADKVIMTTCILHNFIKYNNAHARENTAVSNLKGLPRQGGSSQSTAFDVRNKLALFFDSPAGAM
ncbi:protein ALP1-like [Centruroides sculpturatus]|uniref:protein ALP1-like n=1 Tax=Centruroides sculpturatus TaxID=218467 RepID=UPI000C6EEA96|nr:protein ALP1-like [Centruroides sculpturatus]